MKNGAGQKKLKRPKFTGGDKIIVSPVISVEGVIPGSVSAFLSAMVDFENR